MQEKAKQEQHAQKGDIRIVKLRGVVCVLLTILTNCTKLRGDIGICLCVELCCCGCSKNMKIIHKRINKNPALKSETSTIK
jgi:hypothetical protein